MGQQPLYWQKCANSWAPAKPVKSAHEGELRKLPWMILMCTDTWGHCFCSGFLLLLILLLFAWGGVVFFVFFFLLNNFFRLFVQCCGWVHGVQCARQPSHHCAVFPIHSVTFIPDGCTRSLSNLNFPHFHTDLFFQHGLYFVGANLYNHRKHTTSKTQTAGFEA